VWIYFVISIPLTVLIVGTWWSVDRRRLEQAGAEVSDEEMNRLEGRIMKAIRSRTGARVMSEGPHVVYSEELRRQDYADVGKVDEGGRGIVRLRETMTSWRQKTVASLSGV